MRLIFNYAKNSDKEGGEEFIEEEVRFEEGWVLTLLSTMSYSRINLLDRWGVKIQV